MEHRQPYLILMKRKPVQTSTVNLFIRSVHGGLLVSQAATASWGAPLRVGLLSKKDWKPFKNIFLLIKLALSQHCHSLCMPDYN